jgi:hypothetical protein
MSNSRRAMPLSRASSPGDISSSDAIVAGESSHQAAQRVSCAALLILASGLLYGRMGGISSWPRSVYWRLHALDFAYPVILCCRP